MHAYPIQKKKLKISIKNLQDKKIPIGLKKLKSTVLKLIRSCKTKKFGEISIYFVNNRKAQELNKRYLNKNQPTDVLCFDLSRKRNEFFADIFVSLDLAISNARLYQSSVAYELRLYVIHAILHLLGYDDKTKGERKIMRAKEKTILKLLCHYKRAKP